MRKLGLFTALALGLLMPTVAHARDNATGISLVGFQLAPDAPRVDSPVKLTVNVHNGTEQPCTGITVSLSVDGKHVADQRIFHRLNAGSEQPVSFNWVPHKGGAHTFDVSLGAGADAVHKEVTVVERTGYRLEVIHFEAPADARVGEEVKLHVDLQNTGDAPAGEPRLILTDDGRRVANVRLDRRISPTQKSDATLRWTPQHPGKHQLAVTFDATGLSKDGSAHHDASPPVTVDVKAR